MNLYWVETDDHDEDWFILAEDETAASRFYEAEEGYRPGEARASFVCELPECVSEQAGYPTMDVLESCGARVIRGETPRVVEVAGRAFCEGLLDYETNRLYDDLSNHRGAGRPNNTRQQLAH
jgi:hypothetical protein